MNQTIHNDSTFKVVCLVPSITETLIRCGIKVVGRTRFCIHPAEKIKEIPVVGGTKQARWDFIERLQPDLVVIDKEENPKSFVEETDLKFAITHFDTIENAGIQFRQLAEKMPISEKSAMLEIANRYQKLEPTKTNLDLELTSTSPDLIPGFIKWIKKPETQIKQALYLIWHDPWMSVNQDTFIGNTFSHLGCSNWFSKFDKKYPEIDLKNFKENETLFLCSSEPFPFEKKSNFVKDLPYPSALVDGEVLSWFGIRNLEFLERASSEK